MDFQVWLDDWADCILPGDYDRFRLLSDLPFEGATPKNQWIVTDEAEYRLGFLTYRGCLLDPGANLIARTLRDARRVLAPSCARAWLAFSDGFWRSRKAQEIHTDETRSSPLPVLETANLHNSHLRNRRD